MLKYGLLFSFLPLPYVCMRSDEGGGTRGELHPPMPSLPGCSSSSSTPQVSLREPDALYEVNPDGEIVLDEWPTPDTAVNALLRLCLSHQPSSYCTPQRGCEDRTIRPVHSALRLVDQLRSQARTLRELNDSGFLGSAVSDQLSCNSLSQSDGGSRGEDNFFREQERLERRLLRERRKRALRSLDGRPCNYFTISLEELLTVHGSYCRDTELLLAVYEKHVDSVDIGGVWSETRPYSEKSWDCLSAPPLPTLVDAAESIESKRRRLAALKTTLNARVHHHTFICCPWNARLCDLHQLTGTRNDFSEQASVHVFRSPWSNRYQFPLVSLIYSQDQRPHWTATLEEEARYIDHHLASQGQLQDRGESNVLTTSLEHTLNEALSRLIVTYAFSAEDISNPENLYRCAPSAASAFVTAVPQVILETDTRPQDEQKDWSSTLEVVIFTIQEVADIAGTDTTHITGGRSLFDPPSLSLGDGGTVGNPASVSPKKAEDSSTVMNTALPRRLVGGHAFQVRLSVKEVVVEYESSSLLRSRANGRSEALDYYHRLLHNPEVFPAKVFLRSAEAYPSVGDGDRTLDGGAPPWCVNRLTTHLLRRAELERNQIYPVGLSPHFQTLLREAVPSVHRGTPSTTRALTAQVQREAARAAASLARERRAQLAEEGENTAISVGLSIPKG